MRRQGVVTGQGTRYGDVRAGQQLSCRRPVEDRLAGHPEQIAVLCEHVDAAAIAGRIIETFRTPLVLRDLELTVPVSVGIALAADPGADPDQLPAHADAAMYRAKDNGRVRAELFDDTPPVYLKTASPGGCIAACGNAAGAAGCPERWSGRSTRSCVAARLEDQPATG